MKKRIPGFTLAFFLFINLSYSQAIQWASEVVYQFNEFSSNEFSAKKVLGFPDAKPGVQDPNALKLKNESALGVIKVSFSNPQLVKQVIVVESYLPGKVTEVNVFDTNGTKRNVLQSEPTQINKTDRVLSVPVDLLGFTVKMVEIKLNTIAKKGWSQIDAIGITDSEAPITRNDFFKKEPITNSSTQSVPTKKAIHFSSEVENLGEKINTGVTETKPIISVDGKTLFFCRQNYTYNVGGKKDDQDIWYSEVRNGQWSYAANIGKVLNDRNPNGVSSVSADGNTLLLINEYLEDGGFRPGASVSHKVKGGWSKPEKLNIENFKNKGEYLDFCLASSGKVLIMAVNNNESYGDQDLFVSFHKGENNWSTPVNMGRSINTSKAEFSPFLAADEKTLYFASDGYEGFGKSDIYYSKRLDDTWKNWSKPVNLGEKVNSADWDGYYSVSAAGDYAYLVSTRNSIANSKDIYRIELAKEHKPEAVMLLAGTVYNAKTKEPIGSRIIFETLENGKEQGIANSNPENGAYKIVLPKGQLYAVLAQAKGFLSLEESIDLRDLKDYTEIKKDLYLIPIEIGQKVELKNIFFIRGEPTLLETSYPELDRLARQMKDNPSIEIELAGHTDNQGKADLNLKLSEERVKVVKEYLVSRGINSKRIEIKAYGGSRPVASNATEETRRLNRRVEVTILKF